MSQQLILDEERGRDIATLVEQPLEAAPANDLRHAMMTLPVETQNRFLTAYKASRDNFRDWLMHQLIEGVHYGVPPGCEPKTKEINGVVHLGVWNKKGGGGNGAYDWIPPNQWRHKPSLYAAGADFVCDIMGVRDEYATDEVGWKQMGSKPGLAVVKCSLKSRATGELVGESLGAYSNQYDANNALKMAGKCGKVGAVINAYDLRDLFTQEEPPTPRNDNPAADANAPKEQTRGNRAKPVPVLTAPQLKHVTGNWQSKNPDPDGDTDRMRAAFNKWAREATGRTFNPAKSAEWTLDDYHACCDALKIPTLEDMERDARN